VCPAKVTKSSSAARASPRAAQQRVIAAALELFSRYGVGGTSLQMIADVLGVTKGAIYHQYRSKDEIILAAAQNELLRVEEVVAAAEAEKSHTKARDHMIEGMIDLAVADGRTMGTILNDPILAGFVADNELFRDVMHRMRHLLVGDDRSPQAGARVALLIAATSGAAMHPIVADLDDDTLRSQLIYLSRRFLGLAG
jgi:AcrR family transcriptional regulator